MARDVVICIPQWAGTPPYEPSYRTRCRRCGEALWIAPSSAQMVNRGQVDPVYYACAGVTLAGHTPTFAIGPGQEAEIFEKLGLEGVDAAHELLQRLNTLTGGAP